MKASEQGREERSEGLRGRCSTHRGAAKGPSTPPVLDRATIATAHAPHAVAISAT